MSEITSAKITTRYTGVSGASAACQKVFDDAIAAFKLIKDYDTDRSPKYGNLHTKVNEVSTDLDAYLLKTNNQVNSLSSVKTLVTSLTTAMKDTVAKLNCKFFYQDLKNFFDALCISFVPSLYSLANLIFDCAMVLFFTTLCVYLTALKFSHFKDIKSMMLNKENKEEKYQENVKGG